MNIEEITSIPRGQILEEFGSREVVVSTEGIQGKRELLCNWCDRLLLAPKIGEAFPNEPTIRCKSVRFIGHGKGLSTIPNLEYSLCRIIADYSTFKTIDDAPEIEWDISTEVLNIGRGRIWHNAGTPVDQDVAVVFRIMNMTYKVVLPELPIIRILNCVGKVNTYPFFGGGREQVLFEGASASSQYDYERGLYVWHITYRFAFQIERTWNDFWREPQQRRNDDGSLAYDANGSPIWADGIAGTAGWDRMLEPAYLTKDFDPMMGRPPVSRIFTNETTETTS